KTVRNAFDICAQDIGKKDLAVQWDLAAVEHRVMADPVRLQQVCWNVLNNAVKFTPSGGSIVLRSRNDGDNTFVFEVQDTGIGIEREAIDHIFDAFDQGQ